MKKKSKIYYVPGIISLIGLPILCCIYLNSFSIRQERVLEVVFAAKYDKDNESVVWDTTVLSRPGYKRKYYDIELNENQNDNEVKINFSRVLSREITRKRDTINGVHLIFGNGSKYGSLVKVLNYFRIDSIPTYCPFENHLWVLYTKGSEIKYRERIKERNELVKEQNDNRTMKSDLSFIDKLAYFKTLWPVPIMIILLVIFSIKRLKI